MTTMIDDDAHECQPHLISGSGDYFTDAKPFLSCDGWPVNDQAEYTTQEQMFPSDFSPQTMPYLARYMSANTITKSGSNSSSFVSPPELFVPTSGNLSPTGNDDLVSTMDYTPLLDQLLWHESMEDLDFSDQQFQDTDISNARGNSPPLQDISLPQQGFCSYKSSSQPLSAIKTPKLSRRVGKGPLVAKIRSPTFLTSPTARNKHNAIEKRYRTSLNDRYKILEDVLPGHLLREDKALSTQKKVGKGDILVAALEYVTELEARETRLRSENSEMLEKLSVWESAWKLEKDMAADMACALF